MLSTLEACRVLPVITVRNMEQTVQLTHTLLRGGMQAVEITLRTEAALEGIRAIKAEVPEAVVLAGTVTNPAQLQAAVAAGADYCVSPGCTPALYRAASESNIGLLPAVATASEIMLGMDYGHNCFKLFPAMAAGGIDLLKSLAGPFPDVRFCPTGGLTRNNFRDFLSLPNVVCCGGSWMVSDSLVTGGRWEDIEALAREAVGADIDTHKENKDGTK
ncbi:MAG: bifunctional 4-hydroxy-2-oxoglutarate aldolase/2-dehydro-3-deoxy-phosphogluconate aldolase [Halieaceae bacterium]|mgnify:CR=1 FL=1|jgi:2-dehydro-3-deoxyphosphogluconate aldolase / (4S)-4-hydroxy-2-oxoglutarate aldolase|nr:bifunctional 4-hydroxy-2-oxoglutarate aldolase/2-dehydro-3-deoxy-phosphogluconate aldolase [Halieaceae bacterium]